MDAACGAGTAPEITPVFDRVYVAQSLVFHVIFRYCCLHFR